MTIRRPIGLKEVMQTIHQLEPDEQTLSAIGKLLNYMPERPAKISRSSSIVPHDDTSQDEPRSPRSDTTPRPRSVPDSPVPDSKESTEVNQTTSSQKITITATDDGSHQVQKPVWLLEVEPYEIEYRVDVSRPFRSLLNATWQHTFVRDAAATYVEDGQIDIDQIVKIFSTRQAVKTIPKIAEPTLRFGAQVLVDRGTRFAIFQKDQYELLETIEQLLPSELLDIKSFTSIPDIRDIEFYNFRKILIITDLGESQRFTLQTRYSIQRKWVRLAKQLKNAGCVPVILTPYDLQRYPVSVQQAFDMYHWGQISFLSGDFPTLPERRVIDDPFAYRTLKTLYESHPGLYQLAKYCSLAVRLEPELVREIRSQLLPFIHAGVENDFWQSALVTTQSTQFAVYKPRFKNILRAHLTPGELDRVWHVLNAYRQKTSASLPMCIEEEMLYAALHKKDNRRHLQKLLKRIIKTIIEADEADLSTIRWTIRAMQDMKEVLSDEAKQFAQQALFAATLRTPYRQIPDDLPIAIDHLTWLLPSDILHETDQSVGVRSTGNQLEFSIPAESTQTIDVLKTNPVMLQIKDLTTDITENLFIRNGESYTVSFSGKATITTLTSRRYHVAHSGGKHTMKTNESRIFISHENLERSNTCAALLKREMEAAGFINVFLDMSSVHTADNWRQALPDKLVDIDVLIVLLEEETTQSHWVQREVAIAHGMHISILPVVIDTNYASVAGSLKNLNLNDTQYLKWSDTSFEPITSRISILTDRTRDNQEQLCHKWAQRRRRKSLPVQNPQLYTFLLPELDDVRFHIASGDATRQTGYDVLVNTENNYMQMARFLEKNTLSGNVRVRGAKIVGGRIEEDTVQNELYNQVNRSHFRVLPVDIGQVVITGPGHQDSKLAKHFRFLLHVAAVELNWQKGDINSIPSGSNHYLIENCLKVIREIDNAEGKVIYGKDDTRHKPTSEPEIYEPIESVLFPVFGAGEGGNPLNEAVIGIVDGFRSYVADYKGSLKHIGLNIYSDYKTEIARQVFLDRGFHEV